MRTQELVRTIEPVDKLVNRVRDYVGEWTRFGKILASYPARGADKASLEIQFLDVKSTLAREHQVLKNLLGPDFRFDPNIVNLLSSCTSLESIYSQSEVAVKKLQGEWHRAFISMNETLGTLEDKRKRIVAGEKVLIGTMQVKLRKPFPWKKVMTGAAAVSALLLVVLSVYVMRTFFGFWAPEAGAAVQVSESMSDEERIDALLRAFTSSFAARDMDAFMSTFSDSFEDEEGRSKREIRAMIQTAKTAGELDEIFLDYLEAEVRIDGDLATISPIHITLPDDEAKLTLVLGREGDRWLIVGASGV